MDDVKPIEQPQAEQTAEQPSVAEQTTETPEVSPEVSPEVTTQQRMVPLTEVQEERRKRQELQRKLAELEGTLRQSEYPEDDIMAHPYVQKLMQNEAKRELTDYARDTLEQFPSIPPAVKKAVLKNVRGFVNEDTSDVETAKIDILEYIEEIAAENQQQTESAPKGFPVAATNTPTSEPSIRPADIQEILSKPVDTWTAEEVELVSSYKKKSQ